MNDEPKIAMTKHIDKTVLDEFKDERPHDAIYQTWSTNTDKRHDTQLKWIIDLKFLNGDQWLPWFPRSRRLGSFADLVDSKRPDIVRAVANKLLPAYDHKHGRLCEVLHVPEVVPQPDRADCFETAEIQSQFLQALWWACELDDTDEELKGDMVTFGHSWLKVTFDYDAQIPSFAALGPFEALPIPWGVKRITDAVAMIETRAVPFDELVMDYPEAMKGYDERQELREEKSTLIASTDSFLTHEGENRSVSGMVPVREVYRRPCKKHPRGYHAIVTRKRTLSLQPLKHPKWRLPYFQFRYRYFPGALYPDGLVYPNVWAQVLKNKTLSTVVGHTHKESRPHRMIPNDCEVEAGAFDDMGGDVHYDSADDMGRIIPWYLQVPALGVDTWRLMQEEDAILDEGMQLHDVSRSVQAPNVQSGSQLRGLQIGDQVHLGPVLARCARTWARAFEYALKLTVNEQTKKVTLPGVDMTTACPFGKLDFKADKESPSFRVWVRTIDRSPFERARAEERNSQLLQAGMFNDLPPSEVRQAINKGVEVSMFCDKNRDRIVARHENVQLFEGDPKVHVEEFEDHGVHIEEHRKPMLSIRFKESPQPIQNAFRAHKQAHEAELQAQMEGANAMQLEGGGVDPAMMGQQPAAAPAAPPTQGGY